MPNAPLRFGRYRLDPIRRELWLAGTPVDLPPQILRLLAYLAVNRHRTVSKEEILTEVWGGVHVSETALHQAIRQARLAVDDDGRRQDVIQTVARTGYRFVAAVEADPSPSLPATQPYVGRGPLLAELDEAVAAVGSGRSRILLLSGEPGIGKTRTLDELDRRARAAGLLVARGAGSPHAGAPPFWPWVQVLRELATARPVGEALMRVEGLEPSFGDVDDQNPSRALESHGAAEQFRLYDEVVGALRRAATLGPLVVLLDDLHDAGAVVFELVEFLAREVANDAVLVAAAFRPVEARQSSGRASALARVAALPSVTVVELDGLSLAESRTLVSRHERRPLEPVLFDALIERARGNPFYLIELARDLDGGDSQPRDRREAGERVARSVQSLIVSRLSALSPATRRWLRVAAAVGISFEREWIARLMPEVDCDAAAVDAGGQGIVVDAVSGDDTLAFGHALVRDAVYFETPEEERRRLHLQIAESLGRHQVVEAAFHFAEAAPLGGVERAVEFMRHAAKSARAHFDAETACALYRRSIDLLEEYAPDEDETRCDLLIDLGRCLAAEGRAEGAREALETACRLARRRGWAARFAAGVLGIANSTDYDAVANEDLVARLDEALEQVGEDAPSIRAQLLARKAVEVRYRREGATESDRLIDESLTIARRQDDVSSRARVLEYATLTLWSATASRRWTELSEELVRAGQEAEDFDLVFRGVLGLVTEAMQLGDRASMERERGRCVELAERYPAPFQRASRVVLDTARYLLDGEFEAAERGVQLSFLAEAPEALLPSVTQLYYLHLETGRIAALEDQLLALHEREPHRDSWKLALARLYVEDARFDDAKRHLAATTPADEITRDRLWLPTVALMAECISLTGEKSSAVDLLGLLEPFADLAAVYGRGTLYYGNVSHFLGLLANTVGDLRLAEAYFRRALRAHDAMQSPPWQIRTGAELVMLADVVGESMGDRLEPAEVRDRASRLGMQATVRRLEAHFEGGGL